mmetsp:Transcript_78581/g.127479  ORF Transcript_78581/g.127479 Transcript_78581/m.127479 type:complete len:400 (-) Transcript_78581:50-1249(-)|eukprot:CAMPEP_0179472398 /NCGR_PEP_ID=MMETSP0799-20121207/52400_1 /TAXON_ID=46947 /ORGANISM="Geminigera cryophila, Strain CCMP2564" /LENGTH=399 /DNA_ID=CAMNT_0021280513 /DNA_START=129 /DNA_END=1328 /DNA_ORIENTATION=-
MGGATDTAPATTPPFPNNGPGLRPSFDGVELLLLDHATPPQKLLAHIDKLGTEIEVAAKKPAADVNAVLPWPRMTPELTELLTLEAITTWDYDLIRLNTVTNGKPLALLAYAIIESYGLLEKLKIDVTKLKRYLLSFEATYNTCMYHNPMHAADVMHAFAYLLRGSLAAAMSSEELLIALLAGPAHDLGHPGVNNALLIKQKHPVTVTFPTSVLENHHAALAVAWMEQPDKDVLSFLDGRTDGAKKKMELRQMLKDLVLYTDMSLHGKIMERLNALESKKQSLDMTKFEDRLLTLQTLLHAADLSNPCKKWEIHIQWTHAIVAEFFSQGDLERHMGLEVTPMLDRTLGCGRTSQKGFFIHFIRPLFVLCGQVLPQIKGACDMLVGKLDANVERWVQLGF